MIDYFITHPRRIKSIGRLLIISGMFITIAGLLGNLATSTTDMILNMGSPAPTQVKTLAEIYPTLPTWWIPESFIGSVPAVLFIVLGLWLTAMANQLIRVIECK